MQTRHYYEFKGITKLNKKGMRSPSYQSALLNLARTESDDGG